MPDDRSRKLDLEEIASERPLRFMEFDGQVWVTAGSLIDLLNLAAVDEVPQTVAARAKAQMCKVIADALAFEMAACGLTS